MLGFFDGYCNLCNASVNWIMKRDKKQVFKFLAKVNKLILPSYSKKQLDLSKATKLQMIIIGWRWFVTKNALG